MEYTENVLRQWIDAVGEPDREAMNAAEKRQAALAKPPGSLGTLESLSVQLAGITGRVKNNLGRREILVFCADNGVCAEGVSSAPQSVTYAQTVNLVRGKTGAASIAAEFGCRLRVCDVGVAVPVREPGVIGRKIAPGTKNILKEPAMTRGDAIRAILTGASLAAESVREGAEVLGVGEMGIGNTTTASAVLSVLTGADPKAVTGRGGGITDEAFERKIDVIRSSIARGNPDPGDPVGVLAEVGGFDIAAMAGAYIGAARGRVPVIADGFISIVAALCATRLCPRVRAFLIPSHASYEIGYRIAAEEMGLKPLFDLGMRLGEGSGTPIAMQILDAACAVMNRMATFDEAGIDDGYLEPIRAADSFTVREEDK